MPAKNATARRKTLAAECAARDKMIAEALAKPYPHILAQLGKPSPLLSALSISGTPFNRVGCVFDPETGQLCKQEIPEGLGANAERHDTKMLRIRQLYAKYRHLWSKRGKAGIIARLEGLNIRTVQKYFKEPLI